MFITTRTHGTVAYVDLSRKLSVALKLEPRVNFTIRSVRAGKLEFVILPLGYLTGCEFVKNFWTEKKSGRTNYKTRAYGKWMYDLIVSHGFDTTKRIPVVLTNDGFVIENEEV